jgi:hypothetical protein
VSEINESGNRWEAAEQPAADAAVPPVVESAIPFETVAAQPPQEPPAEPTENPRSSKLPHWVNKRGLVATGTAAAFLLGGGGVGYAIGANSHDGNSRPLPGRFDRSGFGPDQLPGGGQGGFQGQPQDDDGSGSSSGTQS